MDTSIVQQLFDVSRVNIVFAGLASGIVGTCFGHPLDLIKVRLQARSEYKGSWDCFAQTWRNDGLPGLFRGMGSPLFGSSILNVIAFSSYSLLNDIQRDYLKKKYALTDGDTPKLVNYNYALSGLGVGLSCAPIVCPIEVVKVRMQLDRGKHGITASSSLPRRYTSSLDCFKKVLRSEGIFGLYTGFSSTTLRDVSYSVTYFSVYEPLKQFLAAKLNSHHQVDDPTNANFSPLPVILSGGISGSLAWTAALPFDCAKTLIQQPTDGNVSKWDILKAHYKRGGIRGFYNGWIPTIMRAFAVSAIRFLVYESTLFSLNNWWKKKT